MPTSSDGGNGERKSPSGTGSKNHQRAGRPSDDKFRANMPEMASACVSTLRVSSAFSTTCRVPTTHQAPWLPFQGHVKDKLLHSCICQSSEGKNTGTRGVRVPES